MDQVRYFLYFLSNEFDARLRSGVVWSLGGAFSSRLITLVMYILIARQLGQDSFGKWSVMLSSILVAQNFFGNTLNKMTAKYVSTFRQSDSEKLRLSLNKMFNLGFVLSVFSLFIIVGFSNYIAIMIFSDTSYSHSILILSIAVVSGIFTLLLQGIILGHERYREYGVLNFFSGILISLAAYVGSILFGIKGVCIGFTIASIFVVLSYYICVRRCLSSELVSLRLFLPPKKHFEINSYFIFLWMSNILIGPVTWGSMLLLTLEEDGFNQVAVFAVGDYWKLIIFYIPSILINVLFPVLVNTFSQGKYREFKRYLRFLVIVSFLISSSLIVPIVILSDKILMLYGESYLGQEKVLWGMAIVSLLLVIVELYRQALIVIDSIKLILVVNISWAFVQVICALFFIPRYGANGLVVSLLISYSLSALLLMVLAKNGLKKIVVNG